MLKKNKVFPFLATVTAAAVAGTVMIPTIQAASFSDIQHSEYKEAIEKLSKEGILHGYKGELFQPDKQLTRSDIVKMLGKYLVSQGYRVPSNYKTYMRFRDLSPNSQDELLRYAALVYDQGIFTGNQGQLLASDKLSMQHMAVVLVRALSTMDEFDYISYVEEQRFLKEYLDLDLATAEAQKAIDVVDYYDFYRKDREEAYFDPTNIATRGQFAHFFYHLLKIESPARNQPNVVDVSPNSSPLPTTIKRVGDDIKAGTVPKLSKVEQVGAKKMKLTFSEPVRQMGYYDLTFESNRRDYYVESIQRSADQTSFILTMDDYLEGNVTIKTRESTYIYSVSGEQASIHKKYRFTYDNRPTEVIRAEVIREYNKEYLFVTFDRPVVLGAHPTVAWENGQYEQGRQVRNMLSRYEASVYSVGDRDHQVKIPIANLLQPADFEHALYRGDLVFSDIENEYAVQVKTAAVSFVRGKDYAYNTEQLKLLAVETSRTNPSIVKNNRIFLHFNYPVDAAKAADITNYSLSGHTIRSAQVSTSDPKQVELVVANTISAPTSTYLSVRNLTAEKSILEMDFYYELVYLNEILTPVYQSVAKTGTREITITYNEAIATMDPDAFVVRDTAGQLMKQIASNHPTDQTKIVLTFAENISPYLAYIINLQSGRTICDLYGNQVNFPTIIFYP